MNRPVGYCTNVHAGLDLASTCSNLTKYAGAVRRQLNIDQLPVGLWIPNHVSQQLESEQNLATLASTLRDHALVPYTINGFPFGDFHQAVVKHRVYEPAWWNQARADYTMRLARILARLLPPGERGTISTLPLGWPSNQVDNDALRRAANHLLTVADELHRLSCELGREIHLCLEPEPGCVLQTSHDVVDFFDHFLREAGGRVGDSSIDLLGVCHDVCHAVVMCEGQHEAIERYRKARIRIGKVQISSCILVDFDQLEPSDRLAALDELESFAEDRYLHQTTIAREASSPSGAERFEFFEDLSLAIAQAHRMRTPRGEWRIHFHVPVFLEQFGSLRTSRQAIGECLDALTSAKHVDAPDYEIETYAWDVLPSDLQQPTLVDGIAKELRWFAEAYRGSP